MARRLMKGGHDCVVHDRAPGPIAALASEGAVAAATIDELIAKLAPPRAVWMMVPAGGPTEESFALLVEKLSPGDVIVDGGNSFFKDDVRRAAVASSKGIAYLDAGTSGGIWGLERGYCLMVGGTADAFARLEPVFKTLAPGRGDVAPSPGREGATKSVDEGYLHCGPSGAGHFAKMIHNGIEYGLMQAYAEGFEILKSSSYDMNVADIAEVWRRGSVVTSWLLDLTASALAADPKLSAYTGSVQDSGEGRWTVQAAVEQAVPAHVLTAALFTRFRSRQANTFAEKILSAMRAGFGGHQEAKPS